METHVEVTVGEYLGTRQPVSFEVLLTNRLTREKSFIRLPIQDDAIHVLTDDDSTHIAVDTVRWGRYGVSSEKSIGYTTDGKLHMLSALYEGLWIRNNEETVRGYRVRSHVIIADPHN